MNDNRRVARLGACLGLILALAARVLAAEMPQPITPTNRIDLFNGTNLAGWTFCMTSNTEPALTWSAASGVIKCTGMPAGYMRTEKTYRNYTLTIEWRFTQAGNGGFLVHMQSPDRLWPACVQCQGKHQSVGDLFLMNGAESREHLGKDANTVVPKRGEHNEKPVGEWNVCELVCDGTTVKVYVNGRLMNETTECTVSSGHIGLQSEGGVVEVRRMFIEPRITNR